jgi:DNA-directed RNA polymerase specialized sigma24 family protein
MELADAIAALPHPYAVALRLDDAGQGAAAIAIALAIEPEAVPMVLRLGRQKLAAAVTEPGR